MADRLSPDSLPFQIAILLLGPNSRMLPLPEHCARYQNWLLIRLYNQQPIIQFDHGHLIRTAPAIHDRIVRWYYQGWAPPLRNHHEPLTLATVEGWTAEYRPHAARLVERYRRAPSPGQMIAELMEKAPTPGLEAKAAVG